MSENNTIECYSCRGLGVLLIFMHPEPIPCQRCGGHGAIPAIHGEWRKKGQAIRDARRAERIGIHQRANQLGLPASVYSDYEQGWRNPDELTPMTPL